jgi:Spy/CpxP family protein refolding chaperone
MKKLLTTLMVSLFVVTVSMAQEQAPKDPKQQHAEWEKQLKDELKLNPEQTAKFDAVSKEFREKMDALEKDASVDAATQKERKMVLKKEKETRLMEFLTPEQQATYKAFIERKKAAKQSGNR